MFLYPPLPPGVCLNSCPLSPVMLSNHLILCWSLFLLFNLSQHQGLFQWIGSSTSGGPSIGASASVSALPMNIQGWFPLGLTGLISLQFRDSQESSPAPQFESINSSVLSLLYGPTLTFVPDYWKNHSFDYMDLCWQVMSLFFNMLSRFVIAFLLRS